MDARAKDLLLAEAKRLNAPLFGEQYQAMAAAILRESAEQTGTIGPGLALTMMHGILKSQMMLSADLQSLFNILGIDVLVSGITKSEDVNKKANILIEKLREGDKHEE